MLGMFFSGFLFISTHISLDLLSLGGAEAYTGWGGKLNGNLMASCVRYIRTKNYQNLAIVFKLQSKMSGMFFWDTEYKDKKTRADYYCGAMRRCGRPKLRFDGAERSATIVAPVYM